MPFICYAPLHYCTVVTQWRSQDIADARAQHGHAHYVNLYEFFELLQPPRSVLRPYGMVVQCTSLIRQTCARTVSVYETRNSVDIHTNTAPFDFKMV